MLARAAVASQLPHLNGVIPHPAGAVPVADLHEVFAFDQVGDKTRVGVNAGIVIFCDEGRLGVGTEQFQYDVGGI